METKLSGSRRGEGAVATFLRLARSRRTIVGALKVAVLVGTVLNLINQGAALSRLELDTVDWWKAGLTYLVPFCVSVYSATRMQMQLLRTDASGRDRMDP